MFAEIETIIADIRAGKMIVLVDDEDRENEGDLVMAAEAVSPEAINFMAHFGCGLICAPVSAEIAKRLELSPMVGENREAQRTAFTESVDAASGIATGISAADRARTIKILAEERSQPGDLVSPGHVFPLIAKEGGVLVRAGHTEAAVDFARLAGFPGAGVICEIMKSDGQMARLSDLKKFSRRHNFKLTSIAKLIEYRQRTESLIAEVSQADFPTKFGTFELKAYRSKIDRKVHLALIKGDFKAGEEILVRVHSECLTGDVFGSRRCDCGEQLARSLSMIEKAGKGVFLYMRQEGRGIGLFNKIKAYHWQDKGLDTVEANAKIGFGPDLRNYGVGAQILKDLGLSKIKLITNNPKKIAGLSGFGLEVVERVSIEIRSHKENRRYLRTKKEKLGHLLKSA